MTDNGPPCKIITFCAPERGAGQTFTVANIAWLLAANGKRVLVIDWDTRDPSLHCYFRQFLLDKELRATNGLIDFVADYAMLAATSRAEDDVTHERWFNESADITRYAASVEWPFPNGGTLDFVPAGRQGPAYDVRACALDWSNLYERLGGHELFEAAKRRMRDEYDYVLIDCQFEDESVRGICAVQMPDAVVVCFRLLSSSGVERAAALTNAVLRERPDVKVFPVPVRAESSELATLNDARERVRGLFPPPDRPEYWRDVESRETPFYKNRETIVALTEPRADGSSLLGSVERLVAHLTGFEVTRTPDFDEPPEERVDDDARRVDAFRIELGTRGASRTERPVTRVEDVAARAESLTEPGAAASIPVFISYSHEDEAWRKRLQEMLAPIKGQLDVWDDKRIEVGDLWREEIRGALAATKVAVLLVSPSFLDSKFIQSEELPPIFMSAKQRGLTIFWVAVSYTLVAHTYIINFQAANDPERPLDTFRTSNRNRELVNICNQLLDVALGSGNSQS
jgi:cellulose biosynthesis protein BcsQ